MTMIVIYAYRDRTYLTCLSVRPSAMNIITDSYAKGKTHMRYLAALSFLLTFSHQASAQDVQPAAPEQLSLDIRAGTRDG